MKQDIDFQIEVTQFLRENKSKYSGDAVNLAWSFVNSILAEFRCTSVYESPPDNLDELIRMEYDNHQRRDNLVEMILTALAVECVSYSVLYHIERALNSARGQWNSF